MVEIQNLIENTTLQAFLFSPIMGVLFSILFVGSNQNNQTSGLSFVNQQKIIIKHHYHRTSTSNGNSDLSLELIAVVIAVLLMLWLYSSYAFEVQVSLIVSILMLLFFSVASTLIGYLKGTIIGIRWFISQLLPIIVLTFSFIIAHDVSNEFPEHIPALAQKYNVYHFYFDGLSKDERIFMFDHLSGMILLVILVLEAFAMILHNLALMKAVNDVDSIWSRIALKTRRIMGVGGLLVVVATAALSVFFFEGYYSEMLHYR